MLAYAFSITYYRPFIGSIMGAEGTPSIASSWKDLGR